MRRIFVFLWVILATMVLDNVVGCHVRAVKDVSMSACEQHEEREDEDQQQQQTGSLLSLRTTIPHYDDES